MSETIRVLVGITRRLDLPAPPRAEGEPGRLEMSSAERIRTLIEAAKRWAEEMEQLQDAVQRRPDLFPISVPGTVMPTPEGFDDEVGEPGHTIYWHIPGTDLRLGFTRPAGWCIYRKEKPGESVIYELSNLRDIPQGIYELDLPF